MITADDLRTLIITHDDNRPRSLQTTIGPSELGHPCSRRLVHKLVGTAPSNTPDRGAAYIGTAVHAALADALAKHGNGWATEVPILIPGYNIPGNVDAWHAGDGLVLDWKVVGDTALKSARKGPSEQYRTQVHLYGLGIERSLPDAHVRTVAIAYVPRSGRLTNLILWSEDYDENVAEVALRRYESLQAVAALGPSVAALVPTADAYCTWCPYWLPAATDLAESCPGHTDPVVDLTTVRTTPNTTR